jgi:ATP-binding cassette subfamily B protein
VGLAKVEAIYFPSMALMIGLSTLVTIMIGGMEALQDTSKVGLIVEFVIYINMLTFPVIAIGWTASMIQRAAASQKRLNEFLKTEPVIANAKNAVTEKVSGDIVFTDMSFTYPHTGIKALQHIDLRIKKGDKVLILGRTGSGKSTLAQLLLRFYDPTSGTIQIGGTDIRNIDLKTLREQISYVQQDIFLFSDSVSNNISFGLPETASKETVEKAAASSSVHKEILGFNHGYDTLIGERGVTLSGGQKQRISIARALIKEPEIIVFDDCLSAVDAKTENEIIGNLYRYLHDKTAIIITHRIFSSFQFSNIIVLDNGELAEQGTHEQLMANNGYYAELYRLQLTEEKSVSQ